MNDHVHSLCQEDHSGTSTHGLPDPAWLGKPHCEYCGETLPQEILDAVIREAAIQAAVQALAGASIEALDIVLALAGEVEGTSPHELELLYGVKIAGLILRARTIDEAFKG